jgi:hypothetical protein
VQFGLLGPLEVVHDGRHRLGAIDRIVDDYPPARAHHQEGDAAAVAQHMARADQIRRDTGYLPSPYMPAP